MAVFEGSGGVPDEPWKASVPQFELPGSDDAELPSVHSEKTDPFKPFYRELQKRVCNLRTVERTWYVPAKDHGDAEATVDVWSSRFALGLRYDRGTSYCVEIVDVLPRQDQHLTEACHLTAVCYPELATVRFIPKTQNTGLVHFELVQRELTDDYYARIQQATGLRKPQHIDATDISQLMHELSIRATFHENATRGSSEYLVWW